MLTSNSLCQKQDAKQRPIIFVGHSFGGIVIEQVSARNSMGRRMAIDVLIS